MQQITTGNNIINNNRLAKNTLILYFRMLLLMVVSLYSTRIILITLGVVDFGIYNVVGGVVAMLVFLNGTLTIGTQRFLTFQLGENNLEKQKKIFSVALLIHMFLAFFVVIIAETVGLWFFHNKLNIPPDRIDAALFVFHFAVFSSVVLIIQAPYHAIILAHERMSVHAYIGMGEALLKLLITYILLISSYDKLTTYSILIFSSNVVVMLAYRTYSLTKFKESHFSFFWDKNLVYSMLSFSGWNIFGTLSSTAANHGVNILLNLFFGSAVNAARGISFQASMAIYGFVHNYQIAVNPQIIKSYANNDIKGLNNLLYRNAKYAFLMLLLVAMPLWYETNTILNIWLKKVPENTELFFRLILIQCLIESMINPLVMATHAIGKMRDINLTAGIIMLLIVPVSYFFLKAGAPAYMPFLIYTLMVGVHLFVEIYFLRKWINFSFNSFFHETFCPVSKIFFISITLPTVIFFLLEDGFVRFFLISASSVTGIIISSYYLAIDHTTRNLVNNFVKGKLRI